jgi:2-amino-4-hydroxy-6-hydroxymethyldihydropteridine diphosphokinase
MEVSSRTGRPSRRARGKTGTSLLRLRGKLGMILIGIGSNLAHAPAATPRETVEAALAALSEVGIGIIERSRWYLSEPVPSSDQPWFVNGVAMLASELAAAALLDQLLALERRFGRTRSVANAARTLDLDLLDYDSQRCETSELTLPHPRLYQRRFVLEPLCEIAPGWRHPRLGATAVELLQRLPAGERVAPLETDSPRPVQPQVQRAPRR